MPACRALTHILLWCLAVGCMVAHDANAADAAADETTAIIHDARVLSTDTTEAWIEIDIEAELSRPLMLLSVDGPLMGDYWPVQLRQGQQTLKLPVIRAHTVPQAFEQTQFTLRIHDLDRHSRWEQVLNLSISWPDLEAYQHALLQGRPLLSTGYLHDIELSRQLDAADAIYQALLAAGVPAQRIKKVHTQRLGYQPAPAIVFGPKVPRELLQTVARTSLRVDPRIGLIHLEVSDKAMSHSIGVGYYRGLGYLPIMSARVRSIIIDPTVSDETFWQQFGGDPATGEQFCDYSQHQLVDDAPSGASTR